MALYKIVWCILLLWMGYTDGRSRSDVPVSSREYDGSSVGGFKFDDEYLTPEATQGASRREKEPNECEKIMKNSMICMVCKNSVTNAKYERCSYVSEPSEQSFDYAKSKVDGTPLDYHESSQSRLSKSLRANEGDGGKSEQAEQVAHYPERSEKTLSEYVSESERVNKNHNKDNCREEERDGMSCMVCVDSDTGGNFEKCSYAYQPNDKVYKFSKSKRFGYPEVKTSKPERRKSLGGGIVEEDKDIASEETVQVNEKKKSDNCREVVKDGMTCTVCKDPKSGGNSEQCSYSYEPDDKLYAYSQSRSYGSPKSREN